MLTPEKRRALRARGHHLKPVVLIGQLGLTEAVLAEIEIALDHHELIKVRLPAAGREERTAMLERIAGRTGAEIAQTIGHIALIYRENTDKKGRQ